MTVFFYTIKRILKDKGQVITMLLVPIGFITLMMMVFGVQFNMAIGIVDNDNTELTQSFIDSLNNKGTIKFINKEEIQDQLLSGKIHLGLVIPAGFTKDTIDMKNPQIEGYSINETDVTVPVMIYIENFLASAKHIAASSGGDYNTFKRGINDYLDGSFIVSEILYDVDKSAGTTLAGMGFLVMSMMFFSTSAASIIMEDRENKTFYRIISAPVKLKSYMFQNIISFLFLLQLQIISVFLLMKYLFKMNMGPSLINILIVLFVFSVVCIAFAIALTSLSKNSRQISSLSPLLIMPMVMLGGSFWPRSMMPELLIKISNLVPTTWVLISLEKILFGKSIRAITTELGILLLFSLVFFLLGTWKKSEIAD
ncbi:ABC transporter permease [Alkaliphilus peptidifermentans]|uniref:ABC-2 type transport system permease protein n=1 Tax=Alkaliphilus peptidifermentans DSM 18978 TaxID=1120976 RepID=A0A1G5KYM6_9FIRM|nr:ABC transporter permease [Alkaliphilus peptidifermentans]SCZ05793.1 ABC-2 type transport system permease protein [Alkaliphilus peptidifermentans DSM 18978]